MWYQADVSLKTLLVLIVVSEPSTTIVNLNVSLLSNLWNKYSVDGFEKNPLCTS